LRLVVVLLRGGCRGAGGVVGAIVHWALWFRLGRTRLRLRARAAVVHEDVDTALFGVWSETLVLVVVGRLGVLRDDVPSVEEARDLGWRRL
jgi:hypothetical protein